MGYLQLMPVVAHEESEKEVKATQLSQMQLPTHRDGPLCICHLKHPEPLLPYICVQPGCAPSVSHLPEDTVGLLVQKWCSFLSPLSSIFSMIYTALEKEEEVAICATFFFF